MIESRGLTQVEAGAILGIKQPHVSAALHNHSDSFSAERLRTGWTLNFEPAVIEPVLIALGQDFEITFLRRSRRNWNSVSGITPMLTVFEVLV
jgi:Helix-turn-helix domain